MQVDYHKRFNAHGCTEFSGLIHPPSAHKWRTPTTFPALEGNLSNVNSPKVML